MIININRTNRGNLNSVDNVASVDKTYVSAKDKASVDTYNEALKLQKDIEDKTKKLKDASYISDSNLQMTSEIEKLKQDTFNNRADPSGYAVELTNKISAIQDKYINLAPSLEAKSAMINNLGEQRTSLFREAFRKETTAIVDNANTKVNNGVMDLANAVYHSPDSLKSSLTSLDLLLKSKEALVSPQELAVYRDNAKKEIVNSYARGLVDQDPSKMKDLVNSGVLDSILDTKEQDVFKKSAEQKLEQIDTKRRQIQEQVRLSTVEDLSSKLFNNTLTEGEIKVAESRGFIKGQDALSLRKSLETSLKEGGNIKAEKAALDAKIAVGQPVDSTSKSVQKTLDGSWDKLIVPTIPAGKELSTLNTFINTYNYIPESAKSDLLGKLNSGSPKQVVDTSKMMSKLFLDDPVLSNNFKPAEIARANIISEYVKAGLLPEQAVTIANNYIVEKGTTEQKIRSKEASAEEISRGSFTEYFRIDPSNIPSAMESEWKTLVSAIYTNNKAASIDAARTTADQVIKANWGISKVNGGLEFTKKPPELFYNPKGVDPSWIREQLLNDVNRSHKIQDNEDVTIALDEMNNNKGKPVYRVFYLSANGVPVPAFGGKSWYPEYK